MPLELGLLLEEPLELGLLLEEPLVLEGLELEGLVLELLVPPAPELMLPEELEVDPELPFSLFSCFSHSE